MLDLDELEAIAAQNDSHGNAEARVRNAWQKRTKVPVVSFASTKLKRLRQAVSLHVSRQRKKRGGR